MQSGKITTTHGSARKPQHTVQQDHHNTRSSKITTTHGPARSPTTHGSARSPQHTVQQDHHNTQSSMITTTHSPHMYGNKYKSPLYSGLLGRGPVPLSQRLPPFRRKKKVKEATQQQGVSESSKTQLLELQILYIHVCW